MGVFTRPDSPWYWLWLETTRQKERTDIKIGTTHAQRTDSHRLASDRYHQRMNELAARLYKLPSALPAIRFRKYADDYKTTIATHRGAERERELLTPLVAFFGDDLLTAIDPERVKVYMVTRKAKVSPRTVNREVGLLKSMIRDAAPKYLSESPLIGMKYLPTVTPKRRLMTEAEERRLLAKADPVETALLLLGLDGLIRLTDLLDLRRRDRHGPWLYVAQPKSGEPYEVALSPRAKAALDALPKGTDFYFARYRGAKKERDRRGRVRKALQRLCKRARVRYGWKTGGITFHWATRKTGATRLIQAGAPIPSVQRQGNWKTSDVLLSIYAEADKAAQLRMVSFPNPSRQKAKVSK